MASMEAAVTTIAAAVGEIKDSQKEVTQLMRELGVQGANVANIGTKLETEITDRKHVNDILFDRMHALEQAPVAEANNRMTGVWGAVWGGVIVAVGALIIFLLEKGHS